jgi:hypothetical protein
VTLLESGEPTPSDPDGMVSFERRHGGSVLINNDEIGGAEPFGVPHLAGLRGWTHAVEHLADLRGDRGDPRQAARLRVRGRPV